MAPDLLWRFWRKEKSLASARIQTLEHPACSLVTILSTLFQHHSSTTKNLYYKCKRWGCVVCYRKQISYCSI